MQYLSEYRDVDLVRRLAHRLQEITRAGWRVMEVCGGQTHSILRNGLDQLLPTNIELLHGPGCPVCVTAASEIDKAIELAIKHKTILCTFGDMMRVPGTTGDLFTARAQGGDVRVVYSPLDALDIARHNPDREVVFFAIGFETTAPATAAVILKASQERLVNFSVLVAHLRVPPVLCLLLSSPDCKIDGFLAPGHVCTVMGYAEYEKISQEYKVPIVVTGFEQVDILQGLVMLIELLESGKVAILNQYRRSVRREGNKLAQELINKVFFPMDREWRGVGVVKQGGLAMREEFVQFDAVRRFSLGGGIYAEKNPRCRAGEVLMGRIKPTECPFFATECTPQHPLGAPMVSSEGACAAYYLYVRTRGQG